MTFTETYLNRDDRRQVYDIEFYSADTEYDYEINADDGTIRERNTDTFRIQADNSSAEVNFAKKIHRY